MMVNGRHIWIRQLAANWLLSLCSRHLFWVGSCLDIKISLTWYGAIFKCRLSFGFKASSKKRTSILSKVDIAIQVSDNCQQNQTDAENYKPEMWNTITVNLNVSSVKQNWTKFCNVRWCGLSEVYWCFIEMYYFHLQGWRVKIEDRETHLSTENKRWTSSRLCSIISQKIFLFRADTTITAMTALNLTK